MATDETDRRFNIQLLIEAAERAGYDLHTPRSGGKKRLAEDLGISQGYLSQLLSEERKNPSTELLHQMARVTGVYMGTLAGAPLNAGPALAIVGRIAEGAVMLSHHLPGLLVTEQPIEGLPGAVPGAELVIRESSKLPPVGGWVVLDRGQRLEIAHHCQAGVLRALNGEKYLYDPELHVVAGVVAEVKFRPPC